MRPVKDEFVIMIVGARENRNELQREKKEKKERELELIRATN